jgi:alkanesulfonate monooxygenase SsuD/methylene tetrahydromethanopterin reductase-like flavin-dependent oxidoreductase (luciferase family)
MRLSLFFEIPSENPHDPRALKQRFDEALEQCAYADELGYYAINVVEHHFLPGYSALSCPEQFLIGVAMKTKNVRLRHAIMHLPFNINHPLRIAEHIATLDIMSDGRAEFGGGRSTTAEELLGFGVDPEQTRPQWEETLKMLPHIWMDDIFEWDGELIKVPPRRVTPKPLQEPFPPMWAACSALESARFAGQQGLGGLGLGVSADKSQSLADIYKYEISRAKPWHGVVNNQIGSLAPALCLPDAEEAAAIQRPCMEVFRYQVQGLFAPWIEDAPPSFEHMVNPKRQALLLGDVGANAPGRVQGGIVGGPEDCAEILNGMTDAGYDEVFLFMQMYNTPHEKVMESIEMFAKQVKPLLKEKPAEADVTAAP